MVSMGDVAQSCPLAKNLLIFGNKIFFSFQFHDKIQRICVLKARTFSRVWLSQSLGHNNYINMFWEIELTLSPEHCWYTGYLKTCPKTEHRRYTRGVCGSK